MLDTKEFKEYWHEIPFDEQADFIGVLIGTASYILIISVPLFLLI